MALGPLCVMYMVQNDDNPEFYVLVDVTQAYRLLLNWRQK